MKRQLYSMPARVAGIAVAMALAWAAPLQADTFGGRAFSAFINAPSVGAGPMHLADTGELSPSGGWEGAGALGADVPSVLSANVLNAATSGATGEAASSSSLADVVVLPGHLAEIGASFVRAQAEATAFGSSGVSEIHELTFGGQPVDVTGAPNQTVTIPDLLGGALATLVINEQVQTSESGNQGITVNALHLTLATGEEIIVGSARSFIDPDADVTLASAERGEEVAILSARLDGTLAECGARVVPAAAHPEGEKVCIDFVTGGGFFEPPNSNRPDRVNFGFNAGPRSVQNPEPKGHLNLIDHADGTHVKGVNVDTYFAFGGDPEHCRIFEGDAEFNGVSGHRYTAGVCDYGEPGRDDRFQLRVTLAGVEVYFADNFRSGCPEDKPFCGELDGGNIQLHENKNKCFQEASAQPARPSAPVVTASVIADASATVGP